MTRSNGLAVTFVPPGPPGTAGPPADGPWPPSSPANDSPDPGAGDTDCVNPRDRLRAVSRRVTDPAEVLAPEATERRGELGVNALDVNEAPTNIDLNALLDQVDLNALLARVDLKPLLDRIDVN